MTELQRIDVVTKVAVVDIRDYELSISFNKVPFTASDVRVGESLQVDLLIEGQVIRTTGRVIRVSDWAVTISVGR